MPTLKEGDFEPCHDCMQCKARKTGPGLLGVDGAQMQAQVPLAIVSGDLAGPMREVGIDGN